MPTTFVLVHGAFCSAASWGPVSRELTLLGHRALAVDLPGHGLSATVPVGSLLPGDPAALAAEKSGIAGIGTADDLALVTDVVRRAAEHGPVVLVGHSRGGLTVTAVANAVPELLARIVYVSAWCPTLSTVADYETSLENATAGLNDLMGLVAANPADVGGIRLRWNTADAGDHDTIQRVLLADGSRQELLAYLRTHDVDEALIIDEALVHGDPARWGTVARTYVRLTSDAAFPLALQDRFIADADASTPDNPFDVRDIPTSHVGVQVHPGPLVELLDGLADRG